MSGLLNSELIWTSFGWLCFIAVILVLLALLFPQPGPSEPPSQDVQDLEEDLPYNSNAEEPSTKERLPR